MVSVTCSVNSTVVVAARAGTSAVRDHHRGPGLGERLPSEMSAYSRRLGYTGAVATGRDGEESANLSATPRDATVAQAAPAQTLAAPTPPERTSIDEIIDLYKRDVDRGLLREALRLTPTERVARVEELVRQADAFRSAKRRREDD
jgi:hypothetical protein